MNTRSEQFTKQLLEYFQGKPEGRYSPYDIRMDLGISSPSWRWFANRDIYPEKAKLRIKLKEIGVEIETVLKKSEPTGHTYRTSTFVVKAHDRS